MSAPRIECRALALLLLSACAASPSEPPTTATPMAGPTLDMAPAPTTPAPVETLVDLEASLAAYEAQLAHNEDRLRAMGVRIAAIKSDESQGYADDRFAPPPPRPNEPELAGNTAREEKSSSRAKPAKKSAASKPSTTRPGDAGASPPSPAPRPQADAPMRTGPTGDASKRKDEEPRSDDADGGRCVDLCDLATSTCELEAKICDLAARHAAEPRYGEVCRRAEDDCRLATEACTRCAP